ncbi:MAG: hypothetical protein NTZ59_12260 [Bacteroidetes bacterium]|nr:hypothetical protein [Bacteroidota bacterium]
MLAEQKPKHKDITQITEWPIVNFEDGYLDEIWPMIDFGDWYKDFGIWF